MFRLNRTVGAMPPLSGAASLLTGFSGQLAALIEAVESADTAVRVEFYIFSLWQGPLSHAARGREDGAHHGPES